MLAIATEFPANGSFGFLRASPENPQPLPIRIQRNNPDGTVMISVEEKYKKASSTRTVPLAQLAATLEEASPPLSRKSPRAASSGVAVERQRRRRARK